MQRVKLSADFEIRIPETIREQLNIRPGQEFSLSVFERSILLKPFTPDKELRSISELRGAAKGIRWRREDRDRF